MSFFEEAQKCFAAGDLMRAKVLFNQALDTGEQMAAANCQLGVIFISSGEFPSAIRHFEESLVIDPAYVPALANLGKIFQSAGCLTEALNLYDRALKSDPERSELYANRANILVAMAKHDAAYADYEKALFFYPGNARARSDYLLSIHYVDIKSDAEIFAEHQKWSDFSHHPAEVLRPYKHKKIKIAYVSADFRRHSVAYFIEGILHFHDREAFEIFCYSDVAHEDEISSRIKSSDLSWKSIVGKSDDEVHEMVLEDEIDVLVDLGGHCGTRMSLFARRNAPLQVSYCGYPNTSGLTNMDLRLVDSTTDPGEKDEFFSEETVRLNRCFLAFCPPENSPEVSAAPCIRNSYVTFGSFNSLSKITPIVISTWSKILRRSPDSRLILKCKQFHDRFLKKDILALFEKHGVSGNRLDFLGYESQLQDHLELYSRIDLALDTFPYNGVTTTCEALHMGVPVLSCYGERHVERVGLSLLESCGLHSLCVKSAREYIKTATNFAKNPQVLVELRSKMRGIMHTSELCDSLGLTKQIEKVFRENIKK